ncbi:hypothetical protein BKA61DRAFT_531292 [Leptodontidium sp. MPI-SDFR-AT-0119]|nr:hypothetical protein BKA61DRAFT_531292 [Leptodontidium sp. MPI-SDFR-AT-0119]
MAPNKEVFIIGGGVSGLGMACQLQRLLRHQEFTIYEKSGSLGGTWNHNQYPGCACDIPSHFYSYSFAMKPDWTTTYPGRDELLKYVLSVADQYDVHRRTRLYSELLSAQWDVRRKLWICRFRDAQTNEIFVRECAALVSAVGTLDKPLIPQLDGQDTFKGKTFHSARWEHDTDFKNKNVVVLGNGASATQFITPLTTLVGPKGSVTQIVRSAHWWIKRGNAPYSSTFKNIMRYVPGAAKIYRTYLAYDLDRVFLSFYMTPNGQYLRDQIATQTKKYIATSAPEEYKSILLPNYEPGCKRRVNTNNYLETLHKPNMHLARSNVTSVANNIVRTAEGEAFPADILIYATGFETQEWLFPMHIIGADGTDLASHWKILGGAEAYKGTVVSNFPNFFIMYGPNAATGQHSVIFHSECQINYACRLLAPVLTRGADSIEVKATAQKKDLEWVHSRMPGLVFNSGCQSWWMNPVTKKNTFIYPDPMVLYWIRSIFPRWDDFTIQGRQRGSWTSLLKVFSVALIGGAAVLATGKYKFSGLGWDVSRGYLGGLIQQVQIKLK